VSTALVTSNNLPILSGPGIYFEEAGLVNRNELVSVLALNPGRNWALIETASGVRGWIQLRLIEQLTVIPDELPEVEVDPLAQSTTSPGPSVPTPSGPPDGLLVFQTSSGGNIMRINADGTGLQKVSTGIDPVLSPDGKQVAFTRWQGDVGTLWVANVDGSGERAVLGEMRKAKGPDWSPDGSQIVLNYQHGGQPENQEVCQSPGRSIPFGRAENIRVKTEDGRVVAICYTLLADAHWSLRVINVADGSFEDMYGGLYAFRPAWDPRTEWRVVSDAGNGLLAVDVNNDDFRQQLTSVIQDGSPVFSPDGRFIAVTTREQNGSNIYRLNADGSGRVQLTQTPLWEGIRPDEESRLWNNVAPAWSPDGSRIAFLTDRSGRWEIWVMNADGSDQQPLFSEEINNQLDINYDFVDERVLSWR
jgi:TolB protein